MPGRPQSASGDASVTSSAGSRSGPTSRIYQARAHSGLARVFQAGGDPVQARHHWQQALTHYTGIGVHRKLTNVCPK
jgi:hypothetical protein